MSQDLSSTPSTSGILKRLGKLAGLDFHVLQTIVFRGWGILAGAITLVLLPLWLSPAHQGYYYTFASLLALQVFFELGLSQVIIQLVGREAAHLRFDEDGTVSGLPDRVARLSGIVALVRRWYAIAALLFVVLAGLAGVVFLDRHGQMLPMSQWAPVWGIAVVLTAINLYFSPQLAVIEGTGKVGQVSRLRLVQSMVGYGALWMLLIAGAHLWAVVAVPFVSACATVLWLRHHGGWLKTPIKESSPISWRREVFPLQWRIAVSWACGYFIFSLFTPIVFASQGAIEAGRLGMAMTVFSAVSTLGLSWINANMPRFVMHISRDESEELNKLFRAVGKRAILVTGILSYTVVAVVAIAEFLNIDVVGRISSYRVLFWIASASVINVAIYSAAAYMRAHGEEPMLPVSLVSAIVTALTVIPTRDNTLHLMICYACVGLFVATPLTIRLFIKYWARR